MKVMFTLFRMIRVTSHRQTLNMPPAIGLKQWQQSLDNLSSRNDILFAGRFCKEPRIFLGWHRRFVCILRYFSVFVRKVHAMHAIEYAYAFITKDFMWIHVVYLSMLLWHGSLVLQEWYGCPKYQWRDIPLIARFMGPTWGPSGADRTQVGPMLASWTSLSGTLYGITQNRW